MVMEEVVMEEEVMRGSGDGGGLVVMEEVVFER